MKTSEKTLVKLLTEYFEERGFLTLQGVRLNPREIDLLLFDPSTIKIIAVEVKRDDWRKAFSQAVLNKLYAHFSLIAISSHAATRISRDLLHKNGIGLIEISEEEGKHALHLVEQATVNNMSNRIFIRNLFRRFANRFGENCYDQS